MSNMSYCRFENTNSDLADCEGALENLINGEESPLNEYELGAAKALVKRCQSILAMMSELPHSLNLENDGDEVDPVEFDFDDAIDQLQHLAIANKERDEDEE